MLFLYNALENGWKIKKQKKIIGKKIQNSKGMSEEFMEYSGEILMV